MGGDDAYDMVRYGLKSRPILADRPSEPKPSGPGVDPWVYVTTEDGQGHMTQLPQGF